MKHSVKELRESYDKNMWSHFTDHVISSSELCNCYRGFLSVDVLNAVFEYLTLSCITTKNPKMILQLLEDQES